MENAAKAADGYGDSMESATAQTVPFADQVAQATQSMRDQRVAALGAFDAVTQYGDALKAAQDAAAKGKRGLDANTEAGRENRQALSGLAAAWNNQSDAVKNNSAKFRSTRRDFIDTATAMGATEAQARRLAQQLLEIPPSRKIRVLLDSGDALTRLDAIRSEMASIKDKTVRLTYFVNQVNTSNVRAGGGRDGDPSTPYWTGGYTGRGGKFEPAGVVHRGEFVFSAEATVVTSAGWRCSRSDCAGIRRRPGRAQPAQHLHGSRRGPADEPGPSDRRHDDPVTAAPRRVAR
jgi:hypothetical protein